MSNTMNIALTGLAAFGKKLEVTANNTVNVNTDGFKKSRAEMTSASPDGVRVTISQVNTPGTPLTDDTGAATGKESSNVSLEEEMVNLSTTKYMYEANAKVISAEDEMIGTLLDIKS